LERWQFQLLHSIALCYMLGLAFISACSVYKVTAVTMSNYLAMTAVCAVMSVAGYLLSNLRNAVAKVAAMSNLSFAAGDWLGWTLYLMTVDVIRTFWIVCFVIAVMAVVAMPLYHDVTWLAAGFLFLYIVFMYATPTGTDGEQFLTGGMMLADWLAVTVLCAGISYVLQRSYKLDQTLDNAVDSAISMFRDPVVMVIRFVGLAFNQLPKRWHADAAG
jgi:hypothetical protein